MDSLNLLEQKQIIALSYRARSGSFVHDQMNRFEIMVGGELLDYGDLKTATLRWCTGISNAVLIYTCLKSQGIETRILRDDDDDDEEDYVVWSLEPWISSHENEENENEENEGEEN